ncbi:4-demethylwyosine synthase TYW1 [Candidatus Pacearchaeota archaeon]|nr:4-demethylwyosine synthase TYW1 [Candidatus Pacearchaeota archaeon]MBD3283709.1 4-demethylwyosine synthase TYW1 [Candidatus Pacearchaeota archaeon]
MSNKSNVKKILEKQGYRFVGNHSSIKICRWTKKSLIDEGECYKSRFYGINTWRCCQISPWIGCNNKCRHCWRPIEINFNKLINKNKIDSPEFIINNSIKSQQKLLTGFKGNKKINSGKFREAQEPMQFAISLTGEPTLYPKLGEFIAELRKKGKTSFVVTNGLQPGVLSNLNKEGNLPTQLYLSVNASNKKSYDKWHRSKEKNAWKKFNDTLELFPKLKGKTRTVIRMTLVKDINMKPEMVEEYVKLIKKARPDFIEVKGFMSVGFARKRLGYEMMPRHNLVRDYAEKIAIALNKKNEKYKILDEHEASAVILLGKDKKIMKIKRSEV